MNVTKRIVLALAAVIAIAALAATSSGVVDAGGGENSKGKQVERTEAAINFRNDMRKLWEDHVTWTRLFIVSFAADAPDTSATADRLLQNQTHIGDAIKPYYGEEAGNQLTALLRAHILGAVDLLQAAKTGDTEAFNSANAAWYANGEQIAEFLHGANPDNWPLAEMVHHMHMHLDLTLEEAAARLSGDFAADIAAYDEVHVAILEMSDFLSLGIIHQFPKEFR